MYDELIKRLRETPSIPVDAKLHNEAADAIEELSHIQIAPEKIIQTMWIPVTERLPLLNTPVLATDGIEVDISWMYGVPPRWITNYTAIDEDKLTHWMPLPKTPQPPERKET